LINLTLKPIIKSVDELKGEAVFICYEPFKKDMHGHWMSDKTIEAACVSFNKSLDDGVLIPNLFHSKDKVTKKYEATSMFTIEKSWVMPIDCTVSDTEIVKGTWLTQIQFVDKALLAAYLSGDVMGISIGAQGAIGNND